MLFVYYVCAHTHTQGKRIENKYLPMPESDHSASGHRHNGIPRKHLIGITSEKYAHAKKKGPYASLSAYFCLAVCVCWFFYQICLRLFNIYRDVAKPALDT